MTTTFKEKDLVWAKMRGYPHWPAKIAKPPRGVKPSSNKFYVFFYGTHQYAWMSPPDLCPYEQYKDKYIKPSHRKGFNEAVWEIEEELSLTITSSAHSPKKKDSEANKTKQPSAPPTPCSTEGTQPLSGNEKSDSTRNSVNSETLSTSGHEKDGDPGQVVSESLTANVTSSQECSQEDPISIKKEKPPRVTRTQNAVAPSRRVTRHSLRVKSEERDSVNHSESSQGVETPRSSSTEIKQPNLLDITSLPQLVKGEGIQEDEQPHLQKKKDLPNSLDSDSTKPNSLPLQASQSSSCEGSPTRRYSTRNRGDTSGGSVIERLTKSYTARREGPTSPHSAVTSPKFESSQLSTPVKSPVVDKKKGGNKLQQQQSVDPASSSVKRSSKAQDKKGVSRKKTELPHSSSGQVERVTRSRVKKSLLSPSENGSSTSGSSVKQESASECTSAKQIQKEEEKKEIESALNKELVRKDLSENVDGKTVESMAICLEETAMESDDITMKIEVTSLKEKIDANQDSGDVPEPMEVEQCRTSSQHKEDNVSSTSISQEVLDPGKMAGDSVQDKSDVDSMTSQMDETKKEIDNERGIGRTSNDTNSTNSRKRLKQPGTPPRSKRVKEDEREQERQESGPLEQDGTAETFRSSMIVAKADTLEEPSTGVKEEAPLSETDPSTMHTSTQLVTLEELLSSHSDEEPVRMSGGDSQHRERLPSGHAGGESSEQQASEPMTASVTVSPALPEPNNSQESPQNDKSGQSKDEAMEIDDNECTVLPNQQVVSAPSSSAANVDEVDKVMEGLSKGERTDILTASQSEMNEGTLIVGGDSLETPGDKVTKGADSLETPDDKVMTGADSIDTHAAADALTTGADPIKESEKQVTEESKVSSEVEKKDTSSSNSSGDVMKEGSKGKTSDAPKLPTMIKIQPGMSTVEVLQAFNYNIKASLTIDAPNVQQALITMRDVLELQCTTSDLEKVPDLVHTIRKLKHYRPSAKVVKRAEEVYNKLKGLYMRPAQAPRPLILQKKFNVAGMRKRPPTMAEYIQSQQQANKQPRHTPQSPQRPHTTSTTPSSSSGITDVISRKPTPQQVKMVNTPLVPEKQVTEPSIDMHPPQTTDGSKNKKKDLPPPSKKPDCDNPLPPVSADSSQRGTRGSSRSVARVNYSEMTTTSASESESGEDQTVPS